MWESLELDWVGSFLIVGGCLCRMVGRGGMVVWLKVPPVGVFDGGAVGGFWLFEG